MYPWSLIGAYVSPYLCIFIALTWSLCIIYLEPPYNVPGVSVPLNLQLMHLEDDSNLSTFM